MTQATDKIVQLLTPLLEGTDMFLVNIKIKPTNNIKVFIDADSGFAVERSITINRRLYAAIDEHQLYPDGDFSLEVSSPGVDEPLTSHRQYVKNVGRKISIIDEADVETIGMMTAVTEEYITLEVKKPKQKDVTVLNIPFSSIKKAVIQIIF
jgi:ribosome maturation factor RimP